MKQLTKILLGLIFALSLFVFYTMYSTGFFRQVSSTPIKGEIKIYDLPGVEDMALSRKDSFLILSSDDRSNRRSGKMVHGGLYFLNLKEEGSVPTLLSKGVGPALFPHGISLIESDTGTYKLFVINHPPSGHCIEVYLFHSGKLTHIKTLKDEAMISPNDVFAMDENRFYFTNDHGFQSGIGKIAEDYLGFKMSNVVYFDGTNYQTVADGIAYANGLLHDKDRNLLFVASPRSFKLKVYKTLSSGQLSWQEDVYIGSGIDNLEFDENGMIWTGSHPNLLKFSAYAAGKQKSSPSEIIRIDYHPKGESRIEVPYIDDGDTISASTVAIPFGGYIYIGNVMDDHFIRIPGN